MGKIILQIRTVHSRTPNLKRATYRRTFPNEENRNRISTTTNSE